MERYPEKCKQFLCRIEINKDYIEELRNWLQMVGVEKSGIYPDLENISKSITDVINEALDDYFPKMKCDLPYRITANMMVRAV